MNSNKDIREHRYGGSRVGLELPIHSVEASNLPKYPSECGCDSADEHEHLHARKFVGSVVIEVETVTVTLQVTK